MMTKPNEGRGRKSPMDMTAETGRMMLRDLIHFNETGFSPFLRESYESEKFWRSRAEYQKVPLGVFKAQAGRFAEIAIAQMPSEERRRAEEKIRARVSRRAADGRGNNANKPNDQPIRQPGSSSSPEQCNNTRVQSLRDTIVAPYPNNERAIVIFELDGDVEDATAFQLQFSQTGQQISIFFRVPKELTSAESLLGVAKGRDSIQDADCMLLEQVIKERLKGSEKDERGELWEIREIVDLPFRCKKNLFNKQGKKIESFLLRTNEQGYGWGYFWVVGEHVGQREYPTIFRCEATADEESDDDQNSSQFASSDDEFETMSVQYESSADDSMNGKITELQRLMEMKTSEIHNLKNDFDTEKRKLEQQIEVMISEATRIDAIHQAEKEQLCDHLNRLQQKLDAKIEEEASKNNFYNEECRAQKNKVKDLQNEHNLKEKEYKKNLDVQRQQLQRAEAQIKDFQNEHNLNEKEYKKNLEVQRQHIQQLEAQIQENRDKEIQMLRINLENENMMKATKAKQNEYTKVMEAQQKRIQELSQNLQRKDEEHQKMFSMKQDTIQNLERSMQQSNVELATLRGEIQKLEHHYTRQLETTHEKIQELEQELLQKEKECCDHLLQITKHKKHSEYQRKCIKHFKMRLEKQEKCKHCGLKRRPKNFSQEFFDESEDNQFFDEQDWGWSQNMTRDDPIAESSPDVTRQYRQRMDSADQNELKDRNSALHTAQFQQQQCNTDCEISCNGLVAPDDTNDLDKFQTDESVGLSVRDNLDASTRNLQCHHTDEGDKSLANSSPADASQAPIDDIPNKKSEDNKEKLEDNNIESTTKSSPINACNPDPFQTNECRGLSAGDDRDESGDNRAESARNDEGNKLVGETSPADTAQVTTNDILNEAQTCEVDERETKKFQTEDGWGFLGKRPRHAKHRRPRKHRKQLKTVPEDQEQQQPTKVDFQLVGQTEGQSIENQGRKRKSSDFLPIEDAHDLPNKKVRKSRRLEEKRLAKEKKTKID